MGLCVLLCQEPDGPCGTLADRVSTCDTACVTVVKASQSIQPEALPSSPPFRFSIFLNHEKA